MILADLPRILARPNLPTVQLPGSVGSQAFGQLAQAADVFVRINEASDEAEARNAAAVTRERIKGAIQESEDKYSDAETYKSFASGTALQIQERSLEAITSSRARRLATEYLAPSIAAAQSDVEHTYWKKKVLGLQAKSANYLEIAERELAFASRPQEVQNKETEIVDHIGDMIQAGAYSQPQAQKLVQGIKERDSERRAVLDLKSGESLDVILKRYPNLDPAKILTMLNVETQTYNRSQRDIEQAEKKRQAANARQLIPDAATGQMTASQIHDAYRLGTLADDDYRHALAAAKAYDTAKTIETSDQPTYMGLFDRIHQGDPNKWPSIEQVNQAATANKLSLKDWQDLRKDLEVKLNRGDDDIVKKLERDPYYRSAKSYLETTIPRSDSLSPEQKFRRANAMRDFETLARAAVSGETIQGKKQESKDLPGIAERLVEDVIGSSELISKLQAELRSGVRIRNDKGEYDFEGAKRKIADLKLQNKISDAEARNQWRIIVRLEIMLQARKRSTGASSTQESARSLGSK